MEESTHHLAADVMLGGVVLLGAALIAQVQNMLGNRERLRCEAQARPFTGTKRSYFVAIVAFHITWFAAFVAFVWRHLPT